MHAWEDRLGLVDEILPEWMRKKKISETTPNECYDFLAKNKVYKKNASQSKALSFRNDLRDLEEASGMPCKLSNIKISHSEEGARWNIQLLSSDKFSFDKEDDLDRKKIAEKFSSIILSDAIKNRDHNGLVVALDSAWGTGKTYFIKKWQSLLGEKYNGYKIKSAYYNAWENDDYENALIPLISEIYKCSDESELKEIARKTGKIAVTVFGVAARQLIRNKTGLDTKEIAEEIQDAVENSVFKEYTEHSNNKLIFKKTLSKLPKKDEKIVIFIDELDRCRPQFAIETLEAIKHFMNVKDFIFIFSIDMEQLSHSVATLYGQNMDASGYLARFFDIQFRLPTPNIKSYLNFISKGLDIYYIKKVCSVLENIFYALKLSLRDINHIYDNLHIFLDIYNISGAFLKNNIEVYAFLISLKYKYPEVLNEILYKRYNANTNYNLPIYMGDNTNFVISESISEFIGFCRKNKLQSRISAVIRDDVNIMTQYLNVDMDYNSSNWTGNTSNPQEKVYEYIERKLEFIDYIKKEDENE